MKTYCSLFFGLIAVFFTSCQQIDLTKEGSNSRGELYVTCSYTQQDTDMNETRSTGTSISDVATRIEYIIMQDGKVVSQSEQTGSDSDFGTFSINLDPGTYRLIIFAHDATAAVSVSEAGVITFPNDKPTDSFSYTTEFQITKNQRQSLSCQLSRVVTMLYLKSKDVIPTDVTGLNLSIEGASVAFDGVNQKGVVTTPVTKNITSISAVKDKQNSTLSLNTYLFIPSSQSQVNATLQFVGTSSTVTERTLESINLAVNTQSTVTATLFTESGSDCTVTVDAEWLTPITQEF